MFKVQMNTIWYRYNVSQIHNLNFFAQKHLKSKIETDGININYKLYLNSYI